MLKGLKRSVLGGESLFITRFTAPVERRLDRLRRASLPGDIVSIEVEGAMNLTRGAWLCSSAGGRTSRPSGAGSRTCTGSEGGFLVRAEGSGPVVASCYGGLDVVDLAAGESQVLDSGHLVAFSDGTGVTTRKAQQGRDAVAQVRRGPGHGVHRPGQDLDPVAQPEPS